MDRADVTYRGMAGTARALYRVMDWPVEVVGDHVIPLAGPFVVASNHVSHIDPLHLGVAVAARGRRLSYMAKRELFGHPAIGPLLRWSDQIEVDRGGTTRMALEGSRRVLEAGGAVAVFPEGTISPSFVPAPPRLGAARIALEAGCPVIPAAVWGGQRIVTKGRSDPRRRHVPMSVRFGTPILPEADEDERHLAARTWEVVMALTEASARAYPEAPGTEEERWWQPAHLGGSAPGIGEALRTAREEAAARRRRRAAELSAGGVGDPRTATR